MFRALMQLILVILVLAVIAMFLGYRLPFGPAASPSVPTAAERTPGSQTGTHERAREVGAEIGEKVAAGASVAERAVTNAQLTAKIKAKMALDDTVSAMAIDVDTNGTVVTLSGTVDSAAQRARAVQLARETSGVTSVVDRLQVRVGR